MTDGVNPRSKLGRRTFLGLAATAPAIVIAPSVGATVPSSAHSLTKKVVSFLCYDAGNLYLLDKLANYQSVITAPPNYGSNVRQVVRDLGCLIKIGYACDELRGDVFSGLSIAELASLEWDALEKEWLPVVKIDSEATPQSNEAHYFHRRHSVAGLLKGASFSETTLLSDAANILEARCVASSHMIIRQAYEYDPIGFIRKFHEDAANVGLMLHDNFERQKYPEYGRYIPSDIAHHIEAMYPFSDWAKGRKMEMPTGLNNRLFNLGQNNMGQQLFHIALSVNQAKQAVSLLLGQEAIQNLSLREAEDGGVVLTLSPDQYKVIGNKLISVLAPESQPTTDVAPATAGRIVEALPVSRVTLG